MPSKQQRNLLDQQVTEWQKHLNGAAAYLRARGFTRQTAERFRLGVDPADGRLVIPYLTPTGPWTYKKRCIEHDNCKHFHPDKYLAEAGAPPRLFNAQTLLTADRCLVVEGEMDAMAVEQLGLSAVAFPGASNWQRCWRFCFDSCLEVVVVGDGDEPGRKAAGVVAESLRSAVSADVSVVVLPDGEDANSFINSFGEEQFLAEIGWL